MPTLQVRRMHIDTYQEPVIYMRDDCHICQSEGFEAKSRIEVWYRQRRIIATLNVVGTPIIAPGEAGLSEAAWRALGACEGATVGVAHLQPLHSFSHVRGKLYGTPLDDAMAGAIVRDVVAGNYSDIEMATFLAACAGDRMNLQEMIALTRAMVDAGSRLSWKDAPIVDKHCVGGLPGNRTTLLVVPIVAACGLTIPKTSSRAITSPAGTADTMETLAPVKLGIEQIQRVVWDEGGCIVWGGAVNLSPADDILIRVERPLDLDSDGQLVASVLSKKIAAGSTHVLVDIPVGPTAKVRTSAAGERLVSRLRSVGDAFGLTVCGLVTDGTQPIGRGIGPALEARDVLAVLNGATEAPRDLRERALLLAASIVAMGKLIPAAEAQELVQRVLDSGAAWRKFQAICAAQGGMREPPVAGFTYAMRATHRGRVDSIDNRKLARIAKLAGAPKSAAAGIYLHCPVGRAVEVGEPLFTIHAESRGELEYARLYGESIAAVVAVTEG
ncbi:thymidine phosphorylase family protein [Pseudoduganella sp. OTU4001]|uniref:thymidine phosphorylase family protein n=1 Tax=Pseudoduganella sp. OTU4001 TaxID=3043854 RepID=UPI00313EE601